MKHLISTLTVISLSSFGLHAQSHGDSKRFHLNDYHSIEMVWVAPGEFLMGSPDSEPERNEIREKQHKVKLTKGFWIAKTETTQAVWESITGNNPSKIKGSNHPVESISWKIVQMFIKQLNKKGGNFVCLLKPNGNMPVELAVVVNMQETETP